MLKKDNLNCHLYVAGDGSLRQTLQEQIKEIASFQLPANDMVAFTIAKNFKTSISPLEAFYFEELPELIK